MSHLYYDDDNMMKMEMPMMTNYNKDHDDGMVGLIMNRILKMILMMMQTRRREKGSRKWRTRQRRGGGRGIGGGGGRGVGRGGD